MKPRSVAANRGGAVFHNNAIREADFFSRCGKLIPRRSFPALSNFVFNATHLARSAAEADGDARRNDRVNRRNGTAIGGGRNGRS
jgi:hypothetical protein